MNKTDAPGVDLEEQIAFVSLLTGTGREIEYRAILRSLQTLARATAIAHDVKDGPPDDDAAIRDRDRLIDALLGAGEKP